MKKRRFAAFLFGCMALLLVPTAGYSRVIHQDAAWLKGWPQPGHDPQWTDRSPSIGPLHPRLVRTVPGVGISLIAADDTMYGSTVSGDLVAITRGGSVISLHQQNLGLAALAPGGVLLEVGFANTHAGPSGPDDAVAVGLDSSGRALWKIQPFGVLKGAAPIVTPNGRFLVPIVGPEGTDYLGLDILSANTGNVLGRVDPSTPVLAVATARDGVIYTAVGREARQIEAHRSAGRLMWSYALGAVPITGLVVTHHDLYVGYGRGVDLLDPHGRLLWQRHLPDAALTLGLRRDGVLLVVGHNTLTALSPSGAILWKVLIGHSGRYLRPSLIIDRRGTAYVGTGDGGICVISSHGVATALLQVGPAKPFQAPRALLTAGGHLIVDGADGNLWIYH